MYIFQLHHQSNGVKPQNGNYVFDALWKPIKHDIGQFKKYAYLKVTYPASLFPLFENFPIIH